MRSKLTLVILILIMMICNALLTYYEILFLQKYAGYGESDETNMSNLLLKMESKENILSVKQRNGIIQAKDENVKVQPHLVKMYEYLVPYLNDENVSWKNYFYADDIRKVNITACQNLQRPSKYQVRHWKNVYQHLFVQRSDAFLLNFYFDDRFVETGNRFVRTVIAVRGPGSIDNKTEEPIVMPFLWNAIHTTQFGLFWYEGFQNPVSSPCYVMEAAYLLLGIDNNYYYQFIVTCKYPEIDLKPVNISLVTEQCGKITTYRPILYPEPKRNPAARDIGVCVQPMFGSMDKSDVTYFISWLEMMKIFGVSEVSINNVSLTLKDKYIAKAFKYYEDSGFLTVTHYPIIHPTVPSLADEFAGSYSMKQLAVTDCFMRKIHKYWYVLIHDMDEIVVPYKTDTYVEYLESVLKINPHARHLGCLGVRSSYFYRFFPPENNEYPNHIPLLKLNRRFPPEPLGIVSQGGVGMSKSFYNMRTLISPGSHKCHKSHNPNVMDTHTYLPMDDILIHHYRKECDIMNGGHMPCSHLNATIVDRRLERYSSILIPRVNKALQNILS